MNESSPNRLQEQLFSYGDRYLAPADTFDPLLEAFKRDVDRALLRQNLKLTPKERFRKFLPFMKGVYELRGKANPNLKVWR